ncbi:hypothetical protein M5K25_026241 [Dendrobium thyrsiflorum]|uniref:Pentatricopeptide repeat-containing protein n=1 Tax=Dendrobium thyrsiflorum TaxID=117978 RepID=A0ABD0TX57_DENTH
MISAYARDPKLLTESYELFSAMPNKNNVTYATMITGFSGRGMLLHNEEVYQMMPPRLRDPNGLNALISGQFKFSDMVFRDVFTWSSMVDGYWKNGMVLEARQAFEVMPVNNVVSWNSLITGYVEQDKFEEAYAFFDSMQEKDVISWTSIVMSFSKRGWTKESIGLFELLPQKDDVSWTVVIPGLIHNTYLPLDDALIISTELSSSDDRIQRSNLRNTRINTINGSPSSNAEHSSSSDPRSLASPKAKP